MSNKISILFIVSLFLFAFGCKKSKESQIKDFVKTYNSLKNDIVRGNGFEDTECSFKEPNLIKMDIVVKSKTKAGIKSFLSKYEPKDLTKAIDYIAEPTFLLEEGVEFEFNFYTLDNQLLVSKIINRENYQIYKKELATKGSPNFNTPFYLNLINEQIQTINKQLPISVENVKFLQLNRDEKGNLVYKCSCTNTKKLKENNRIMKSKFEGSIKEFPFVSDIYVLMKEVKVKTLKFDCIDEDTKKQFDFVFYPKNVLDLY
jgi:hypothetical protein